MAHQVGNTYFENQVLTASPERLQFILLDSALRASRRAEELIASGAPVQAGSELAHAESIVADMLGSMRRTDAAELVDRAVAVYGYILKMLTDAHLTDDLTALGNAIRVLEFEQETWRLASQRNASPEAKPQAMPLTFDDSAAYQGGFVFDA